ncbi:MAG: prolyl 4-hydroxylase [Sphingomonadales bacterium]|jgi:prolyl 4-hydroxylase|nr:prolyl 4-hydroxylase [Sphingomonadales bacterium]
MSGEGLMLRESFLSPPECASIREELAYAHWYPSRVVGRDSDGEIGTHRISETTDESWFTPQLSRRLRRIEARIEPLLPGFGRRREHWQATRYSRGGTFKAHFDCGAWRHDPEGDREHTVLIFLNRPRRGGETCFPHLGLVVRPAAGLFAAWRNLKDDGAHDRTKLHSSLAVAEGRKLVLVTWVRQREFERRAK